MYRTIFFQKDMRAVISSMFKKDSGDTNWGLSVKKNIWIFNHYSTDMFYNQSGRHYWFANNLKQSGYDVTIFGASTKYKFGSDIQIERGKFASQQSGDLTFVFVKCKPFADHHFDRVLNMISFAKNLSPVAASYAGLNGKPDLILASSVHPLTLVTGLRVAKRFGVPCICEVRDLWPETLVASGKLKKSSILAMALYKGERWIYEKADGLVFTMEGGIDYVTMKGWTTSEGGEIDSKKVHYINNGIDLLQFDQNLLEYEGFLSELFANDRLNFIYTGSIRYVNNLDLFLEPFAELVQEGYPLRFIAIGGGNELEMLEHKYQTMNNIIFAGPVDKKYVPSLLAQADVSVLCSTQTSINRFGISPNKLFDYMAASQPILNLLQANYDLVEGSASGLSLKDQSSQSIREGILHFLKLTRAEREKMGQNGRKLVEQFDFKLLTDHLIDIIEDVT
jgi:glycosyltransferase involved in cell wall biosynthesis